MLIHFLGITHFIVGLDEQGTCTEYIHEVFAFDSFQQLQYVFIPPAKEVHLCHIEGDDIHLLPCSGYPLFVYFYEFL